MNIQAAQKSIITSTFEALKKKDNKEAKKKLLENNIKGYSLFIKANTRELALENKKNPKNQSRINDLKTFIKMHNALIVVFKKKVAEVESEQTSGTKLEIGALGITIDLSTGATEKVLKKFELPFHKPLVKRVSYPIPAFPAISVGAVLELKTIAKAELKGILNIKKKTVELQLDTGLNMTAKAGLTVGDTTGLLELAGLIVLEGNKAKKSFKITNLASKCEFSIGAFDLEFKSELTLRSGPTLRTLYQILNLGDGFVVLSLKGKSYKLISITGSGTITKEGLKTKVEPIIGPGVAELKEDMKKAAKKAADLFKSFMENAAQFLINSSPGLKLGFELYKYLTKDTAEENFNKHKAIYDKAIVVAIEKMIAKKIQENKGKESLVLQELKALKGNKKKYLEYAKSAENIPIVKAIYEALRKGDKTSAARELNNLGANISLEIGDYTLSTKTTEGKNKETKEIRKLKFKIKLNTDKKVTIDKLWVQLQCGAITIDRDEEINDTYDPSDTKPYPWELEIDMDEVKKLHGDKPLDKLPWKLWVKADFKGNFKDVFHVIDVTKEITK